MTMYSRLKTMTKQKMLLTEPF